MATAHPPRKFADPIAPPNDFRVQHAINQIEDQYGDTVSVNDKKKALRRFGTNPNVGTSEEEVWDQGGSETLATSNSIDTVSSSSASDTNDILVEGHTLSGSDLAFVKQTATLNGQNKVVLTTPLYRATYMHNHSSTDFVGDIYCYEDDTLSGGVPTTSSKIHLKARIGENQSQKAATSQSSVDYMIITELQFAVSRQQTRTVDFTLQIKEFGKTWQTVWPADVNSATGTVFMSIAPCIIMPPNSDMKVTAISSGTTTGVTVIIAGYLAIIT